MSKNKKGHLIPKHGSSDGRVGDLRLKGPGFNPQLEPMRLCLKTCPSSWEPQV